jgi:hypothetical protein
MLNICEVREVQHECFVMCVCIHTSEKKFWDIFKGEFTLGVKDFSVSQVTLISHLGLLH